MTEAPAAYTFVPWFRRGLAADIAEPDNPAAPATGRASVPVSVTAGWTGTDGQAGTPRRVTRSVDLIGPGDIASLKAGTVLRCHPPDGTPAAQPGELAYVEFYDEDLPWRYSPAASVTVRTGTGSAAVDGPRLRPWLALLVLADGEFTLTRRPTGTPVVTVHDGVVLPPPDQAWAWAHAQLAGSVSDPAQAGPSAEGEPDASLSRLMSPRRLAERTAYTAFVVPAFDAGRRAQLGLDVATTPVQRPAWGAGQTDRRLPVYFSWTFSTGVDEGFETLVRRLRAQPADPGFGSRPMAVDAAALGIDADLPDPIRLEGALRPLNYDRADYPTDVPGSAGAATLQERIDAAAVLLRPGEDLDDDPIVSPPLYGGPHSGVQVLGDVEDADPVGWVRELNLDPRNRAAAGLGAQVVRDRQEDLMVRAWAQVGQLRDANQRLREAELALAAAEAAFAKHLEGSLASRLLLLTAPAHGGLAAPSAAAPPPAGLTETVAAAVTGAGTGSQPVPSIFALVDTSRVPTAVEDPTFRALTRPQRPLLRAAAAGAPATGVPAAPGFQAGLIEGMDRTAGSAVSAAPPLPVHPGAVTLAEVTAAVDAAVTGLQAHDTEPKRVFLTLLADVLAVPEGTPPPPLPTPDVLANQLGPAIDAWEQAHPGHATEAAAVRDLAGQITDVRADGLAARVELAADAFRAAFGSSLAAKAYRGVVVASATPNGGKVSRMTDLSSSQEYHDGVDQLGQDLGTRLDEVPDPPGALGAVDRVVGAVLAGMAPDHAVRRRVVAALPGLADHLARQDEIAQRRLRPVLAYPQFPDPMIEPLQAMGQDYVLPNLSALPVDTLTVMTPNGRFIESYLAGLTTELARELLWREYPTDLRGSYFRVFWDRRDADPETADAATTDVPPLPDWTAPLGANGAAADAPLVLVLRSDLLRRFPHTLVTAHPAVWTGTLAQGRRTLDPAAAPLPPLFTATLDPDVALFAFALDETAARGHVPTGSSDPVPAGPGYFFVLQERPGQPRFGLDSTAPGDGYDTWDDLSWDRLVPAGAALPTYLDASTTVPAPADPGGAIWAATSADLAAILLRSPVMYARHADDLLPVTPS